MHGFKFWCFVVCAIVSMYVFKFFSFVVIFRIEKPSELKSDFLRILGAKMVPFEVHLGSNFDIYIYKKSCCFLVTCLGGVLGVPGHPPRLKPLILCGGLFKIEGGPFCSWELPGSILESKIDPEKSPKATKMGTRTRSEDRCENGRRNVPKVSPKWMQNGNQNAPKEA